MKMIRATLVATAVTVIAGSASAATLTYEGKGAQANVTSQNGTGGTAPNYINSVAASFKMKDATNALGLGTDFVAFCLDLAGYVGDDNYVINNTNPFQPGRVLSALNISNVNLLFDAAYASVDVFDNTDAAAFQLALWEAGYEEDAGALSLTSGTRIGNGSTQAITDRANEFLSAMTGPVTDMFTVNFLDADRDSRQDLVMGALNPTTPVPLPGAAVLLLGGLGAFGAVRKKAKAAS